jgi:hypothetical protein
VAIFKLSRDETRQLIADAQAASRGAVIAKAAPVPKAAAKPLARPSLPSPVPPATPSPARKPQDDAGGDWKEF